MSPKIADFREHAFVQQMLPAHSRLLAKCATERVIPKGGYLKRQGAPADEIYLIRSGTVALEISLPHEGALCIETVRAGSVVGWSCFVPPYRWRFDARTLSDVGVFAIIESRIIFCQSRQREDCFQKAVIKRGLRRIRRKALRARWSSSQ